MPRGPLLNNIARNITTRDSLGIESVAASISGEICPVVNTVTPRAFYWPFMVWIYYDFYQYSGIEDRTVKSFDIYLKRQDYFFVLATLLTPGSDRNNLVGITQTQMDIYNNTTGKYPFNPKYFKTTYGGMQYYNAGCLSMRFIIDQDPESGTYYNFPKLTEDGEKLALAFEKVIKDTEYYKKYRLLDIEVPETVLKEYGKAINFGLIGFDECKDILKKKMFESRRHYKLAESKKYVEFLSDKYGMKNIDRPTCRKALFDYRDYYGNPIEISPDLETISNEWEIVIGRQYFTAGLEIIWKYMLEQLDEPFTKQQWISQVFVTSQFDMDIEVPLSELIEQKCIDYDTREKMISEGRSGNDLFAVSNGIKIVLSIYKHFYNREDLGEEKALFDYGYESDSIPFSELFEEVNAHKESSIKEFLIYVMDEWLIQQHYITAFGKMFQNRDGFYYEIIDGKYIKRHEFDVDFQDIRLIKLSQVMKDLEII